MIEPWLIGLALVSLASIFAIQGRSPDAMDSSRLARLERKVDLILAKLEIDYNETVEDLVRSGDRIGAIKKLRKETGVGLKEALDAIKAIERNIKRS
ncbi:MULTISPECIES: hypothetical protein [Trichocoleus]|uniref:Ribosomal protein L7/L12 C-terminal domain-containing protein n=1 Tax=Trichocoleus desertorum GB2-A4 TaxID=2933944 RepID=A0ABV0JAL1_9CYAN|nr:hypothetical protein [Trichocoleus sp. FACHB-46]MBD1861531.1 hypothetical protein [Trichocoleus sp. FACHB-46]